MSPTEKMPEKDELVIATIRKIFPYGAFCSLDEYNNREAFVHISEVASRWVKNIHEFLKENQKVVARVYHFVPEKNQIDLSIKRVSEAEKKLKLESVKRDKRAQSLLNVLAKRLKKEPQKFSAEMSPIMMREFGGLMDAFEQAAADPEAVKKLGLSGDDAAAFIELSTQNIKKPRVEVSRTLNIQCSEPDGIETIKEILHAFEGLGTAETTLGISYLGAPNYKLSIVAEDYKRAEKTVQAISKLGAEEMKKKHCSITVSGEEK